MVAKDGHEDAIVELLLVRLPIDVEVGGVAAGGAIFQHIPPPAIAGVRDAHVIGHDIEDLAEMMLAERIAKLFGADRTAEFGVDTLMIEAVVTVRAAGGRLE